MRESLVRNIIMKQYKNNYASKKALQVYSYQGTEVIIITVFKTGINSIAIVEDRNSGEQFEVFRDQLYET